MKKFLCCLATALLLLPSLARAVDTELRSTTLFRFEKRSTPGFPKQTLAPATEFLGADVEGLADGSLSLHLYGWGRLDLADRSTDEGDADGSLEYGYLQYRFAKANGAIKAGRFFVYEGVAAEQVDGVSARSDLAGGVTLSVFGGVPVAPDRASTSKGEYIVGGRTSFRLPGVLELGASALQGGRVLLDPATGSRDERQMLGGDIWLSPHRTVELTGHTFYNNKTHGVAEHSYLLVLRPVKLLTLADAGAAGYDAETARSLCCRVVGCLDDLFRLDQRKYRRFGCVVRRLSAKGAVFRASACFGIDDRAEVDAFPNTMIPDPGGGHEKFVQVCPVQC